jgi:hypothetical protein
MTFEERFEQDYNDVEKLDTLVYDIVLSTHDYNLLSQIDNRITELCLKEALLQIRVNKKLSQMRNQ